VVGGTAWAIRKSFEPGSADLLVLDEGSQLKVPESAIPIRRLRPGGMLVVAGDDRQLPPIVQGAYPDPKEGEPFLHRSIFECLRAPDRFGEWTAMLLENFRMNRTLCRYPAEQVYVPEYASASEEIARRRLTLTSVRDSTEIADLLIDPGHPLVIGVLEGVRAAAENRIEAELVAAAACRLRERLVDVVNDADFWRRCLFVVSPHHAQIHAIRRALHHCRDWKARPFVDTVDRMQGQECDAVIVSYGVSDVEYAMQEAAFIYSLNRLNVSITRARAKTIVFLPRPLIEPPIQAYEDETLAAGVAFMQGLVQFARRHGEETTHDLANGTGQLQLLRVVEFPG
jgi:DNA replication ATP-dependent helicase Dna2